MAFQANAFANDAFSTSGAPSDTNVAPGNGSVVVTGFAPTIAQPQTAAPQVGALTITGYAPAVARTDNVALTPGVGALTLTGYAPTITQGVPAAAPVGVTCATIMSDDAINAETTALIDRIAQQAGTMRSTIYGATIMRAATTNNAGAMRANAINQIAEFI